MNRAIPWVVAVVATIGFGASYSELQRVRGRLGEVTRHKFHDHQDVRQFMIRAALIGLDQPIVVMGDSVTEMAKLPETINGHPVVNAGIGGATISDFEAVAPRLMTGSVRPSLIVVALGANDIGSDTVQADYAAMLSRMKTLAPRVLAVAVAGGPDLINSQIKAAAKGEGVPFVGVPLPAGSMLDNVHLNAVGYRSWLPAVVSAISGPSS